MPFAPRTTENVHKLLPDALRGDWQLASLCIPAPFPEALPPKLVSAQDPSGFDRSLFLDEINDEIVDFFRENLIRK